MKRLRLPSLLMALAIGSMTACGGGGGDAGSAAGAGAAGLVVAPPQAPSLSVAAQPIRTLSFTWTADGRTTRQELLEDIDGPNGPAAERVVDTPAANAHSHTLEVFLPARRDATYRLRACVEAGCLDSATVGPVDLTAGIGYFKSSHAAEGDGFGQGLALSADGSVVAVGSPGESASGEGIDPPYDVATGHEASGAVQLFERVNGAWAATTYIKPQPAYAFAQFGDALSLSSNGRVLLVGAPGHTEIGGPEHSGAAYVFRRGADGRWAQEAPLQDPLPEERARMGKQVALSGDGNWAAVAAPHGPAGGKVLLYRHDAAGWALVKTLVSASATSVDAFGEALALSADGRTLVVGAPWESSPGFSGNGAAYLYQRDAAGVWSAAVKLLSPEIADGGAYGQSVTVSGNGNVVVIGEPFDSGVPSGSRAAHGYERAAAGAAWVHRVALRTGSGADEDDFGSRLLVSADASLLAVSAPEDGHLGVGLQGLGSDELNRDSGVVYVFRRAADGGWSAPTAVQASNDLAIMSFGKSLALAQSADGTPLLAVYGQDASPASGIGGDQTDTSAHNAGAVYLY